MISTNNKIVVWNCRGAASKAFYMYGKEYINMYKLTMSVVVETQKKLNYWPLRILLSWRTKDFLVEL